MIAQLYGKLVCKSSTEAVVDCGGVGYLVNVSIATSDKLPEVGADVKLQTLLIPREDALNLYGFWCDAERDAFKMLISISGIGPKMALGTLSSVSLEELQVYILSGNFHALQKLPGIGKKTAERLVLELKDKITKLNIPGKPDISKSLNLVAQEGIAALITLGYSRAIAEKAVRRTVSELDGSTVTAEELIKLSLRYAMV